MSILNKAKGLFKKEEPIKEVEQPKQTEEGAKELIEAIKQTTRRFEAKPNTPIQRVNRHGIYGFALRRANKLNRKAGRITPSYPPASYI